MLWEVADRKCRDGESEHCALDTEQCGELLCEDADMVRLALDKMKHISRDSSKRISKKDRKEQRAVFRQLERWVLDGEAPSESVCFHGANVECDSFVQLLLLDALREQLAEGFPMALRHFPVLRYVAQLHLASDMFL